MLTEPKRPGQFLVGDAPAHCYDPGIVDGTVDMASGTIVGVRTADSLHVAWDPLAADGSETATGIYSGRNILAATSPAEVRAGILKRWCAVSFAELVVPDDIDIDDVRAALPNIVVRD